MSEQPIADADDLFTLPLDQFTAARDRLAKDLKTAGDEESAASVAKLRKPSLAAWALNLAVRRNPDSVGRLMASHVQLREATDARSLQEASRKRQTAIAELLELAMAELANAGRPAAASTRERINSTLLATGADRNAEADLAAGRLVREMEPSGEGWADIGFAPPPTRIRDNALEVAAERARSRADKLRAEADKAEHRVDQAERALAEAKRRADEARATAAQAETDAREAEEAAG